MKIVAGILVWGFVIFMLCRLSKSKHEKDKELSKKVECPYCHGHNLSKVSGASKVASTTAWGLGSKKSGNVNFYCKDCESYF